MMARRRTAREIAHLVAASDSEEEAVDDAGSDGYVSEEEKMLLSTRKKLKMMPVYQFISSPPKTFPPEEIG